MRARIAQDSPGARAEEAGLASQVALRQVPEHILFDCGVDPIDVHGARPFDRDGAWDRS